MALRCSLLGHAYGDPEVQRTRAGQGERVVVTVREVRTCGRCGATDVVGERTEVTAAADAGSAAAGDRTAAAETAGGGVRDAAREAPPDAGGVPEADADDGVILEGGPDAPEGRDDGERSRGEWPRRERQGGAGDGEGPRPWPEPPEPSGDAPDLEPGGWPEPGGEDDGFDATPAGGDPDVDLEGGLPPERAGDPPDDAEMSEPGGRAAGGGRDGIPPDRETEFVCPDCGFAERSAVASVRPGDVCPDCRSGYLEERPAGE